MTRIDTTGHRLRWRGVTAALVLTFSLVLTGTAVGQEKAEFEFTAVSGVGLGELGQQIGRAAWGGSFYGGWRLPGTPFSLGGRLAMTNYGSERSQNLAGFSGDVPAGVKYSYNVLMTHVVLRYQPRPSRITPYLETSVGLSRFFTQAYSGHGGSVPIVVGDAILAIDTNGSETLTSSLTPSFGLGGGLKVRLARIRRGEDANRAPFSVSLNLQGRYLYGGAAAYLKPGGLVLDGGRLVSESQRSRTSMFVFSLGVSVGLPARNE